MYKIQFVRVGHVHCIELLFDLVDPCVDVFFLTGKLDWVLEESVD